MKTISVTSEFRHEFEAERTDWLRRRFLWYAGLVGALGVLEILIGLGVLFIVPRSVWFAIGLATAANAAATAVFVGPFLYVRQHGTRFDRERLLRLVIGMIVAAGALNLVGIPLSAALTRDRAEAESAAAAASGLVEGAGAAAGAEEADDVNIRVSVGQLSPEQAEMVKHPLGLIGQWALELLPAHIIASLFIPWTARESYRPVWVLWACGAAFILVYAVLIRGVALLPSLGLMALIPVVGLPGAGIAAWRNSRFRSNFSYRMLRGAYGDMKRELMDARRIHEALFPKPIADGPVRMAYWYEPMRQIGGDYLFARMVPVPGRAEPVFDAAVIDVTGHGISAALTVNRLHGEIQRQLGEKPDLSPGELLKGLNAYLHHTLASHSVYATAVCVRIDPAAQTIEWASAGHPPAFLCTADGRMERLESTAFILGVTGASDYDADQQRTRFMPGDSIVLYTDGAIEARNREGRHLRVDGLQRVLAGVRGEDRVGAIMESVGRHRYGPAEDDTLVVEVRMVVGEGK